jgi:hypothetical protein
MKKDVVGVFLQTLLLLLVLSLSLRISASESHSDSLYVTGKEIVVSPGNITIHYVYFDFTEGRFDPFLLFNVTVSEPGWYHLQIWIDVFNPSDEREGMIEYVCENGAWFIPRTPRPYLIFWPIDMIEFLIADQAVHLGPFNYRWQPSTLQLSAHEYRENAMYIFADFEAVKPGVIECSLWDTSRFFLERLINNEISINDAFEPANITEVKILDEDKAVEFPIFPNPTQLPSKFDIVVYANKTSQ